MTELTKYSDIIKSYFFFHRDFHSRTLTIHRWGSWTPSIKKGGHKVFFLKKTKKTSKSFFFNWSLCYYPTATPLGIGIQLNVNCIKMLFNARSYCCKFSQTSDAFELASTIALVLQASRLIKWGSHPQNQKAFFYYFILKLLLMREHLNKIKKRNNNNNNKNKMKSDIRYIIYSYIYEAIKYEQRGTKKV